MTSNRKITANRTNARKSRGPKTASGKARASHNAFRHGLAAVTRNHFAYADQIVRVAKAILGNATHPLLYEQALAFAECQVLLGRLHQERVAIIERRLPVPAIETQAAIRVRDESAAARAAMPELHRLVRYERRAWSRGKKAMWRYLGIRLSLKPTEQWSVADETLFRLFPEGIPAS